jgi:hypothetical protein
LEPEHGDHDGDDAGPEPERGGHHGGAEPAHGPTALALARGGCHGGEDQKLVSAADCQPVPALVRDGDHGGDGDEGSVHEHGVGGGGQARDGAGRRSPWTVKPEAVPPPQPLTQS